jgi:hypothetical protein
MNEVELKANPRLNLVHVIQTARHTNTANLYVSSRQGRI